MLVSLNPEYHPRGGNGVEGPQFSPFYRPGPSALLSQLGRAKRGAVDSVEAALNATFPGASAAKTAAASAVGVGGGASSSSSSASSASSLLTSSTSSPSSQAPTSSSAASSPASPGFITPVTLPISPAEGGSSGSSSVSFSAATVLGLAGDTFFSPDVDDSFDVANAVRALLVSKLRRLAAEGSADASALLSLGDGTALDGQRTAAPLLSARGVALDAEAGVYAVSVAFPALLPPPPGASPLLPLPATALRLKLMNAVNDVDPSDPCGSLAHRTGFDVCDALDHAMHLSLVGAGAARLLAVESTPAQLFLPFGRRSKSREISLVGALPASAIAAASPRGMLSATGRLGAASGGVSVASSKSYIPNALGGAASVADGADGVVGVLSSGLGFFQKATPVLSFFSSSIAIISTISGLLNPKPNYAAETLTYVHPAVGFPRPYSPLFFFTSFPCYFPLLPLLPHLPCFPHFALATLARDKKKHCSYVQTINATTFRILESINVISETLMHIEAEIGNFSSLVTAEVRDADCNGAYRFAETYVNVVRGRWKTYTDPVAGPRKAAEEAATAIMQGLRPDTEMANVFDDFAKNVLAEPGGGSNDVSVFQALDSLHAILVPNIDFNGRPDALVIYACARSAMADFRRRAATSKDFYAFDDRQYFTPIQNLLFYYQIWQARGSHMIQEALMFRAQQAALSAWAANQAVRCCFCFERGG